LKTLKININFILVICLLSILITLNLQTSSAYSQTNEAKLKVENFFKSLKSLEANFIQVGPSGDVSNGKIYLDLPGKLRLDYEKPNNLLITSKGFWLTIQNRNLKTTNNIPLKSSPFFILIQKKFDFKNKSLITYLNNELGIISLKITNSTNKLEELILEFSEKPFSLKKWLIKDTFGEITTVLIQKAKYNNKLSHLLFFPDNFPDEIN
jgi:outer membrane lipoprotein-sorting protein